MDSISTRALEEMAEVYHNGLATPGICFYATDWPDPYWLAAALLAERKSTAHYQALHDGKKREVRHLEEIIERLNQCIDGIEQDPEGFMRALEMVKHQRKADQRDFEAEKERFLGE